MQCPIFGSIFKAQLMKACLSKGLQVKDERHVCIVPTYVAHAQREASQSALPLAQHPHLERKPGMNKTCAF